MLKQELEATGKDDRNANLRSYALNPRQNLMQNLPTNAYVTLDCEFTLLFRKGKFGLFPPNNAHRYKSAFTKKQRNE